MDPSFLPSTCVCLNNANSKQCTEILRAVSRPRLSLYRAAMTWTLLSSHVAVDLFFTECHQSVCHMTPLQSSLNASSLLNDVNFSLHRCTHVGLCTNDKNISVQS